jgi:hypothetical protein
MLIEGFEVIQNIDFTNNIVISKKFFNLCLAEILFRFNHRHKYFISTILKTLKYTAFNKNLIRNLQPLPFKLNHFSTSQQPLCHILFFHLLTSTQKCNCLLCTS